MKSPSFSSTTSCSISRPEEWVPRQITRAPPRPRGASPEATQSALTIAPGICSVMPVVLLFDEAPPRVRPKPSSGVPG